MGAVLAQAMSPASDPLRNDPRGFGPFSLGDPVRDRTARAAHAANIGRAETTRGISPVRQGSSRRRPSTNRRSLATSGQRRSLLTSETGSVNEPLGV